MRASITSGIAPTPQIDRLGVERRARRAVTHALDALAALEARDLVAADDLDAVLLEHAPEEAPGGGAEAALERMVLEHDHRHRACPSSVSEAATSEAM